jgi:hypothetical protein
MNESIPLHLEHLSDELLVYILQFLEVEDLCRLLAVNTNFKRLVTDVTVKFV